MVVSVLPANCCFSLKKKLWEDIFFHPLLLFLFLIVWQLLPILFSFFSFVTIISAFRNAFQITGMFSMCMFREYKFLKTTRLHDINKHLCLISFVCNITNVMVDICHLMLLLLLVCRDPESDQIEYVG